ncbi:hypothetical protein N482_24580 [Pseudoalteromonas luteoviolacea NCIMB 1942]|uniref:Uncharacterized protein n=1 Tax=Pseudoalteromonas luteoviolacea NCIMB 1942 TaxID=1365253 RepID=A0A167G899_9GAMM|nr:hypothetical protein N482_24580 [Pseudoalteromonas luteoviolacea NCIMB 1942]
MNSFIDAKILHQKDVLMSMRFMDELSAKSERALFTQGEMSSVDK